MTQSNANTYYLMERYLRKMYKDIILNELITFVFYFVFNILFQNHPQYSMIKTGLGFLFMLIAVALLILGKKRAERVATIHYEVLSTGLEYFDGKKKEFYAWEVFVEIKRNPNRIALIFPYEFHTEKGVFTLHRQVDNPDELIRKIAEKTNLSVDL